MKIRGGGDGVRGGVRVGGGSGSGGAVGWNEVGWGRGAIFSPTHV